MAKTVGAARTVKELKDILDRYPDDFPVRTMSLTHEWPVTVKEHQLCLTLEFD